VKLRYWLPSLAVHAALFLYLSTQKLEDSTVETPVVQTLSEDEMRQELARALGGDQPSKQIVQVDPNRKTNAAPPNARYLSSVNTATDRETRAARHGSFQNTPPAAKFFELGPEAQDNEQAERLTKKTGRVTTGSRQPASATDDYLEGVAVGAETVLNAAEYKFYSFYERIREKLAHRWNQELQQQFQALIAQGKTISGTRTTKLEVHMNPAGQIQKIRVLGSAGIEALDHAAIDAFQQAGPYPNPPQALIEEGQGRVKVRWDFVVVADAHQGMRVEVVRSPSAL
jgi:TonB family protein